MPGVNFLTRRSGKSHRRVNSTIFNTMIVPNANGSDVKEMYNTNDMYGECNDEMLTKTTPYGTIFHEVLKSLPNHEALHNAVVVVSSTVIENCVWIAVQTKLVELKNLCWNPKQTYLFDITNDAFKVYFVRVKHTLWSESKLLLIGGTQDTRKYYQQHIQTVVENWDIPMMMMDAPQLNWSNVCSPPKRTLWTMLQPVVMNVVANLWIEAVNVTTEKKIDEKNVLFCVVCMTEPRSHVFLPCRHLCTCDVCCEQMTECPLCRVTIDQTLKVYT
jgi:hypothetical protein